MATVLATLLSLPLLFRAGMRVKHLIIAIALGVAAISLLRPRVVGCGTLPYSPTVSK